MTGRMVTPHVLHQKLLKCGSLIPRICWHHPEFVRNADSQALLQAYWIRNPRGVAQQFALLTGPPGQFSCILESHLHLRSRPTPSACATLRSSLCAFIVLFLKAVLHSCSLPRISLPLLSGHLTNSFLSSRTSSSVCSISPLFLWQTQEFIQLKKPNSVSTHTPGGALTGHPPTWSVVNKPSFKNLWARARGKWICKSWGEPRGARVTEVSHGLLGLGFCQMPCGLSFTGCQCFLLPSNLQLHGTLLQVISCHNMWELGISFGWRQVTNTESHTNYQVNQEWTPCDKWCCQFLFLEDYCCLSWEHASNE